MFNIVIKCQEESTSCKIEISKKDKSFPYLKETVNNAVHDFPQYDICKKFFIDTDSYAEQEPSKSLTYSFIAIRKQNSLISDGGCEEIASALLILLNNYANSIIKKHEELAKDYPEIYYNSADMEIK